jgi:hypothetical protein
MAILEELLTLGPCSLSPLGCVKFPKNSKQLMSPDTDD